MSSKCITVSEVDSEEWKVGLDRFHYSLFISPEWVHAVAGDGDVPIFLDLTEGDEIVAKIAGLITKPKSLLGRNMLFYAYPALQNESVGVLNKCLAALLKFAGSKGCMRLIVASYDQQNSLEANVRGLFSNRRCEYVVNLRPERGEIKFSQNLKRNVKKAEKNRAVLEESADRLLADRLHDLLHSTLEKRKSKYGTEYNPYYLPNLGRQAVLNLLKNKLGRFYYCSATGDNNMHCMLLNIEREGKNFNLLVGSDEVAYDLGLPAFADCKLIEKYRSSGFQYYNLGGATWDAGTGGLERSKQSKGADRIDVYGVTSNFLQYPFKLLNPLLNMVRVLRKEK